MSTYTLFGKEVSFSEAADRYFYILKAFELAAEKASEQFKNFYHDAGNISNVLDGYMKAVYTLTKNWAIDPLYASLKNAEIYDVSEDSFQNACWDLEGAEQYYDCIAEKYNEIVGDLADAKQYRALRKASRSKYGWMSSTEWADMTNAAITAGALNAMSGIGHSIRNGIGNLGSSISAAASKKSLYDNEKTLEILDDGVFECIKSIYLLYMEFVNTYKENEGEDVWYDGSPYDSEKADVLLKNSSEVEGKEKELLFRAFSVCPYHYLVSATIFIKYEEERKNIFQIAKKYKNDLTPLLAQVIQSVYTEDAKESEEKAQEAKQIIRGIMNEYGITENDTLDQIEYDCLVRLCEPYKDSLPGENQALLDAIVAYDATDDNKRAVVKELRILELVDKYGVVFDDDEIEKILSEVCADHPMEDIAVCAELKDEIHEILEVIDKAKHFILSKSKTYSAIETQQLSIVCGDISTLSDISVCEKVLEAINEFDALPINKEPFVNDVKARIAVLQEEATENATCMMLYKEQLRNMCMWELSAFEKRVSGSTLPEDTKSKIVSEINARKEVVPQLSESMRDILRFVCNYTVKQYNLTEKIIVSGGSQFAKKFTNAKGNYVDLQSEEIPLLLFDDTLFGSAKSGFVITNKFLYAKPLLETAFSYALQTISGIESSGKEVLLIPRDAKKHKLLVRAATVQEAELFKGFLNSILGILKETTLGSIEDQLNNQRSM